MSCSLSLRRVCNDRHGRARSRHSRRTIVAVRGYPTFLSLALAQDPRPVLKRAAAKDQSASVLQQSQVRNSEKVLAPHQRLLDEETNLAHAGKYGEQSGFSNIARPCFLN